MYVYTRIPTKDIMFTFYSFSCSFYYWFSTFPRLQASMSQILKVRLIVGSLTVMGLKILAF